MSDAERSAIMAGLPARMDRAGLAMPESAR